MKRILALVLALIVLTPCVALADDTFISLQDFNTNYNYACTLTKSGHSIHSGNLTSSMGSVKDCYIISLYDNSLIMHVWTPHLDNYDGVPPDISEINLLFATTEAADATEAVAHLVFAIGEIALATGGIDSTDELNDFITELDFLKAAEDGASNSITRNGLKYGYSLSSMLGFHFSVLKAKYQ